MEILKPGNIGTADQECPECGCVFQYDVRRDVYYLFGEGKKPIDVAVRCPCCGKSFHVPAEKWPEGILI